MFTGTGGWAKTQNLGCVLRMILPWLPVGFQCRLSMEMDGLINFHFKASYIACSKHLICCNARQKNPFFLWHWWFIPAYFPMGFIRRFFSSTSLNSPSCLFISSFSFLPSSPSIGLGLLGLLSGRFGGERMQSSRKHQLYKQKCVCAGRRINRITQMEKAMSSPAIQPQEVSRSEKSSQLCQTRLEIIEKRF